MPVTIPLSRPDITQKEIDAVTDVLNTSTLSIGPRIEQFEKAVAKLTNRRHAVGVCSGTAGLHCAMIAAGVGPGDEDVTTPFSFVASANCILYVDAKPVFADIDPKTLNLDVRKVQGQRLDEILQSRRRVAQHYIERLIDYPVCEYVSARTLALPFFGNMTNKQINRVCDTLEKVLEKTMVARKGRL